jgi:pyrroline-5-carboxylate reductase
MWEDIILFDKFTQQYEKFGDKPFVAANSAIHAATLADCIILATKPQNFPEVLAELSDVESIQTKLIITIAAGITIDTVSSALRGAKVVRVLPNTPMLIGMGVTAACRNSLVNDEDFEYALSLFRPSGSVIVIDESEMNRIICVLSSSPAYVFSFIKAICDGASAQGLDGDALMPYVCDMVIGSASLLKYGLLSGKTADDQIRTVCSKGGTTERAIASLESDGLAQMMDKAMKACTARADELSRS